MCDAKYTGENCNVLITWDPQSFQGSKFYFVSPDGQSVQNPDLPNSFANPFPNLKAAIEGTLATEPRTFVLLPGEADGT
eukprot:2999337-Pyramimonas_sp.AAC.1